MLSRRKLKETLYFLFFLFVKFPLLYVFIRVPEYCQSAKDVFYRLILYAWIVYRDTFSGPCYNLAKLKIGLDYHLEHITDWSVIWHNFDVVYRTAKKEDRRLDTVRWSERNETRRIRETNETPAKGTSWSSPIRLEPERDFGTSRRPLGRSPFAHQGAQLL